MLNKFIENIKNSLSKKKASTEEIDDAESSSEQDTEDSEESESENSGKANSPKSNRNSMIIRVVVILGLAYVAIDQFVLSNKEEEQVATTAPKPKRKNKGAKPIEVNKEAGKNPEVNTSQADHAATPIEVNSGSVTDSGLKEAPKADITEEKKEEKKDEVKADLKPEINAASSTTSSDTKTEAPVENVNITAKPSEEVAKPVTGEVESPKMTLGETKSKEKELDKQLDQLISGESEKSETPKNTADDLKNKIAVEETYVDPPNYEDFGRGLVYDCKEKRWVCIDKPAYVQCNKNMKYNKGHGKTVECAVVNVYGSTEDCGLIQKFYVSTNKSTDFCN